MRIFIFMSFLTLSIFSYSPLFSEVMIIGIEIPGLHQRDGRGAYDQIITETVVKSGIATLETYPPARARNLFSNCQKCCFSPADIDFEFSDFGEGFIQTDSMNIVKIYIFVNKGKKPISRLEDLQNKRVGIRFDIRYGENVEKANLTTFTVYKLESYIRLIQNGHIDAFLAFVPDAYKMFREFNLEPFPHDVSRPIEVLSDRLVCKGVQPGFIDEFNKSLQNLRNSGRLKSILGDNYIEK